MARRTATFSLLPSVKREWLKALRSGKYKQTTGELFDGKGFCCLGLLCKVNGISNKKMLNELLPQHIGFGNDITPDAGEYWTGDHQSFAWSVLQGGKLTPLSELNDDKSWSFEKIADIIEKQVPTHRS